MLCFVPVGGQAQYFDDYDSMATPHGGLDDDEEHMPPDLRQSFELLVSQQGLLENLSDAEWAPIISGWSALGSGMNGTVRALAHDGTHLYAAGTFTNAGGVSANYVARWDGTAWSPLGSGMHNDGYFCSVADLVHDGTYLYAAGHFTTAGGVVAYHVARWDGTAWSPLGSGVDNGVSALAHDGTCLYAAAFTSVGGTSVSYVAKWDGTVWSPLGTAMDNHVRVLVHDGTYLYAGGSFTTAGGASANRIARWDGTAWSPLGSGIMNNHVTDLLHDGTHLYVAGSFFTAGGVSARRIARWDGTAWTPVGNGLNSTVNALAYDGIHIYAGGFFTNAYGVAVNRIAKWDGTAWSPLGSGMAFTDDGFPPYVGTLIHDGTHLYAGGVFKSAGGVEANRIAQWGQGANGAVRALVRDRNTGWIYAGGAFTKIGNVAANRVARWDGMRWHAVGAGMNDIVYSLALDQSGNLYAGGAFTTAGGISANRVAKWDGSSWSTLGSGMNAEVFSLAVNNDGHLFAGGWFTSAGGISAARVARWNGSAWNALGSGCNDEVMALKVDAAGNLYAGGAFTTAGGISANRVARWNGSTWSPLGAGMNAVVYALELNETGNLYAGGFFTTAGGQPANHIAKWNGSSWSALGDGMNNGVRALTMDDMGRLHAGGFFTAAGNETAQHVARWDGERWSAVGSGTDGVVLALATDGMFTLYVGGGFKTAGGVSANNIAMAALSTDEVWNRVGGLPGANGAVRAVVRDPNTGWIYAGGAFTEIGNVAANRVARWDGLRWHAVGAGMNDIVYSLAVDHAGHLYAGGAFTATDGISASRVARWNGSSWTALGSGVNAPVFSLAVNSDGHLFAGGWFTSAGGISAARVARWNGSAWSALGAGCNDEVMALKVDAIGNLYAGGAFTTAGGISANRVARWNGSAWSPLGTGMNATVYALELDETGNLYAGGFFTTADGQPAGRIAKWNGSSWGALGAGMNDSVRVLNMDNMGRLHAGGFFTAAGNEPAQCVAQWDGENWSAVGSGTDGVVLALVTDGTDQLYAGGGFTVAGNRFSLNIAVATLEEMLQIGVLGIDGVGIPHNASTSLARGTDFGSTEWSNEIVHTFQITNAAASLMLEISNWTLTGAHADHFEVIEIPNRIQPGTASNLVVAFRPKVPGAFTASLNLQNNSTNPSFGLNLRGTGLRQDQTITFDLIPDQSATNTVHLSATSSSGLPVSFSVTAGLGVITGGTNLSFTGSGSVSVQATQSGDTNWNAATPVTRTFNVSKLPATVTLHSLTQTYDGTPRVVTAVTDPPGLTVNITYNGSPAPPVNAGTYAVSGVVDDETYEGSASDTLAVNKANQTITFAAIPDQIATATIQLSATASSGLPVSFAVTAGPGVITGGTNLSFAGSGAVSVQATQSGNANWNAAAPVTRTFNVTKATAAVTLQNLIQTYDGAPRVVTAVTDPAGLTVTFSYDGSPTPPVNAGSYAVSGTVSDARYEGSATGTLTVNKADQTIVFAVIPGQIATATIQLSAMASSGLPVSFAVAAGPGVITGGTNLSFTGSGAVSVQATQSGNANWNAAPVVTRTFEVMKDPNEKWVSLGDSLPGANGTVHAVAVDPDTGWVYIGGSLTAVGNVLANHVAKWDGERWVVLGEGVNGTVHALALDDEGHLYVGGAFTTAGGVSANRVAKWDGNGWTSVGTGFGDTVLALVFDGEGDLYAGGAFTTAGGSSANRVAKWDGEAWQALGSGVNGGVYALALDAAGNLYVGGLFTTAGGVSADRVATWDGTAWSALGTGISGGWPIAVEALAVGGNGHLYVGGRFTEAGGSTATHVAKWDGSTWYALGDGFNLYVYSLVATSSGDVYAAGAFKWSGEDEINHLAKWDGVAWSALGTGANRCVHALTLDDSGRLYAGGSFLRVGNSGANRIAMWDGDEWSAFVSPDGFLGLSGEVWALIAGHEGQLYAGGGFTAASGHPANRVAKWDGSAWSPLGEGVNGPIFALAMDGAGHLYAGGNFTEAGGNPANRIAKWDGETWSALGAGMNHTVFSLVVDSHGHLYAGGFFNEADGNPAKHLAKWDGEAWTTLGEGPSAWVVALQLDNDGNLYAGSYYFWDEWWDYLSHIEKWDGTEWTSLASVWDLCITALAIDGKGHLYAGFEDPWWGESLLWRWDGMEWVDILWGCDWNDRILALATDASDNLYAGGFFEVVKVYEDEHETHFLVANNIARWDGDHWHALGSGINEWVHALAVDGAGNLFAGGDFTLAGDKISTYAALWKQEAATLLDPDYIQWLLSYGLPTDGSACQTDPMNKGNTVLQDWIAGTDPLNELSIFRVMLPVGESIQEGLVIRWPSLDGRVYSLDRSTDLRAGFTPLASDIPADPPENIYVDTTATNNSLHFYRINVRLAE